MKILKGFKTKVFFPSKQKFSNGLSLAIGSVKMSLSHPSLVLLPFHKNIPFATWQWEPFTSKRCFCWNPSCSLIQASAQLSQSLGGGIREAKWYSRDAYGNGSLSSCWTNLRCPTPPIHNPSWRNKAWNYGSIEGQWWLITPYSQALFQFKKTRNEGTSDPLSVRVP